MRKLTCDLSDILDLVHCSSDYGFDKATFFEAMADMTGYVSNEEIQEFADMYLTPENRAHGYCEEDQENALETLTKWRDNYCK